MKSTHREVRTLIRSTSIVPFSGLVRCLARRIWFWFRRKFTTNFNFEIQVVAAGLKKKFAQDRHDGGTVDSIHGYR